MRRGEYGSHSLNLNIKGMQKAKTKYDVRISTTAWTHDRIS